MSSEMSTIRDFADAAEAVIPHRFEIIDRLADGTAIPVEALSEDHSIGIYAGVAPRKMREQENGYVRTRPEAFVSRLRSHATPSGMDIRSFIEYVPLRGVRFRAEKLQYLEEGWTATIPEVVYPTHSVLALMNLVHERFGEAFLYLNTTLPMPLWLRSHAIGEPAAVQVALQAYAGGRIRPTNIHSECTMEYARAWVEDARGYFEIVSDGEALSTAVSPVGAE